MKVNFICVRRYFLMMLLFFIDGWISRLFQQNKSIRKKVISYPREKNNYFSFEKYQFFRHCAHSASLLHNLLHSVPGIRKWMRKAKQIVAYVLLTKWQLANEGLQRPESVAARSSRAASRARPSVRKMLLCQMHILCFFCQIVHFHRLKLWTDGATAHAICKNFYFYLFFSSPSVVPLLFHSHICT